MCEYNYGTKLLIISSSLWIINVSQDMKSLVKVQTKKGIGKVLSRLEKRVNLLLLWFWTLVNRRTGSSGLSRPKELGNQPEEGIQVQPVRGLCRLGRTVWCPGHTLQRAVLDSPLQTSLFPEPWDVTLRRPSSCPVRTFRLTPPRCPHLVVHKGVSVLLQDPPPTTVTNGRRTTQTTFSVTYCWSGKV